MLQSRPRLLLPALVALALALGGCATYVNIPAQSGDVAGHDTNVKRVLEVQLAALSAVHEMRPAPGPFRVVLPAGTSDASYQALVPKISDQATWSSDEVAPGAYVLQAKQVRIRGWYAQVDIVRPATATTPDGPKQLVTVNLRSDPVVGWHADGIKVWAMPLEKALFESVRQSNIDIRQ